MFNLFVNELLESFTCLSLAYADDLKLCASISDCRDVELLQDNLNTTERWCEANMLIINVK